MSTSMSHTRQGRWKLFQVMPITIEQTLTRKIVSTFSSIHSQFIHPRNWNYPARIVASQGKWLIISDLSDGKIFIFFYLSPSNYAKWSFSKLQQKLRFSTFFFANLNRKMKISSRKKNLIPIARKLFIAITMQEQIIINISMATLFYSSSSSSETTRQTLSKWRAKSWWKSN